MTGKNGVRIGLEIHQRLDTGKLFCSCNYNESKKTTGGTSEEITRYMRAVTGETGQVDPAAAFESRKKTKITYNADNQTSCQVETDEEPPHAINPRALETALSIALALKATPLDEIHVMRKTVVDGSAPSGFQRTALIAINGTIETDQGPVSIPTICLEEESAGITEKKANAAEYDLDRLGVPLIEIATDATIRDGKHAAETALKIGQLLRASGKVQRGIGSIRQDLNASIPNGNRVEIKGAQNLELLSELIENEIKRQSRLLEMMAGLNGRDADEARPTDVSKTLLGIEKGFIGKAISSGQSAIAVRLEQLGGLMGTELMPGHRLGTEISDYAKAEAGVTGIIHSDEALEKYGITREMAGAIAKECGAKEKDAWAICVEEKGRATRAINAAQKRARLLFENIVPKETRRAEETTSRFMRPLPGAARMYPETDVPPQAITVELLKNVPEIESPEKLVRGIEATGIPKDMAREMAFDPSINTFRKAVAAGADPTLTAVTLLQTIKTIKRDGIDTNGLNEEKILAALQLHAKSAITKPAVAELLKLMCKANGAPDAIARQNDLMKFDEKRTAQVAEENNYDVGAVMRKYRLNVEPTELAKACAKAKNK